MASSTSTIRWDTRSATNCFNPSQSGWLTACATRTRSAGREETNSLCCSPKWNNRKILPSRRARILQAVAEAHSIDQHDLHITASIGVSVLSRRRPGRRDADQERGHSDVPGQGKRASELQFFKPAMNVRAVERQSIEESLRRALERKELSLVLSAEDQSEAPERLPERKRCCAGRIPFEG